MDNVIPLRVSDITPEMILSNAMKRSGEFKHAMIILVDDSGDFSVWSTQMDGVSAAYFAKIVDGICNDILREETKT